MFSLDTSTLTPQSSFTQSGTSASMLNVSMSPPGQSWIIDSGASDHMTGTSSFFSSYSICSRKDKVYVADGSYLPLRVRAAILSPRPYPYPLCFMFPILPLTCLLVI